MSTSRLPPGLLQLDLSGPTADDPRSTPAAQQSPEHTHHVESLLPACFKLDLSGPTADDPRSTPAAQQSPEHTHHVESLLIPFLNSRLCSAVLPSHFRDVSVRARAGDGYRQIPCITHGKPCAGSMGPRAYMSARVRSPTFNAVLTASPRLVAFTFRKML